MKNKYENKISITAGLQIQRSGAGNGKQTQWKIPIDPLTGYPKTWNKLSEEGFVKITIKSSPNGSYSNMVGKVIQ